MEFKRRVLYNDVVIIGAGFSGINMACQLQRQLGVTDYVIYERAQGMGGAWQANQYPGCAVDIPGALYSLSWFPNPQFNKIYPSQSEILSYIHRVASANGVDNHIRLGTAWTGASWNEMESLWHVYLLDQSGTRYTHKARILVSAVGAYSNPKSTEIPGAGIFEGKIVHTAQWNKGYDLRGLDVAVVGNGCSASQVVPAIAHEAKSVTQLIRRPQHYIPMPIPNLKIPSYLQKFLSWVPPILIAVRWVMFWILDSALAQFYNESDGTRVRQQLAKKSSDYVRSIAPAHLVSLLSPEYDLGCRRRILDSGYIKSLHRDNVSLVRDSIASLGPREVTTTSGTKYPADFIVLATGFEFSQWQGDKVTGRGGVTLQDHWNGVGGTAAYKTVTVNQFPNFFYILGPNSGSGHTSVLYSMECGVNLIIRLARPVLQRRSRSVEINAEAEAKWCGDAQGALRRTVLAGSCANQFSDPKTGWNFFSYPYSSFRLWMESRFPNMEHWIYR